MSETKEFRISISKPILLIIFVLPLLTACDTENPSVNSNSNATQPTEGMKQTDKEIIAKTASDYLSVETATELYIEGCNKIFERIPSECECLAAYFQKNLPDIMFDLEASAEAGKDDITGVLINTMDSMDMDFRKKMGETRVQAWNACFPKDPTIKTE